MMKEKTKARFEYTKQLTRFFKEINPDFNDADELVKIQGVMDRLMTVDDDAQPTKESIALSSNLVIEISDFMLIGLKDELTEPNRKEEQLRKIREQIGFLEEFVKALREKQPDTRLNKRMVNGLFGYYKELRSAIDVDVVRARLSETEDFITHIFASGLNIKDQRGYVARIGDIKQRLDAKAGSANAENIKSKLVRKDVALAAINLMIAELNKQPSVRFANPLTTFNRLLQVSSLKSMKTELERDGKVDLVKMNALLQGYVKFKPTPPSDLTQKADRGVSPEEKMAVETPKATMLEASAPDELAHSSTTSVVAVSRKNIKPKIVAIPSLDEADQKKLAQLKEASGEMRQILINAFEMFDAFKNKLSVTESKDSSVLAQVTELNRYRSAMESSLKSNEAMLAQEKNLKKRITGVEEYNVTLNKLVRKTEAAMVAVTSRTLELDPNSDQSKDVRQLKLQLGALRLKIQSLLKEIEDINARLTKLTGDRDGEISALLESSRVMVKSQSTAVADLAKAIADIKKGNEHTKSGLDIDRLKAKVAARTVYCDKLLSLRNRLVENEKRLQEISANRDEEARKARSEVTTEAKWAMKKITELGACEGCSEELTQEISKANGELGILIENLQEGGAMETKSMHSSLDEIASSKQGLLDEIGRIRLTVTKKLAEDNQVHTTKIESLENLLSKLSDKIRDLSFENKQEYKRYIQEARGELASLKQSPMDVPMVIDYEKLSEISAGIELRNKGVESVIKDKKMLRQLTSQAEIALDEIRRMESKGAYAKAFPDEMKRARDEIGKQLREHTLGQQGKLTTLEIMAPVRAKLKEENRKYYLMVSELKNDMKQLLTHINSLPHNQRGGLGYTSIEASLSKLAVPTDDSMDRIFDIQMDEVTSIQEGILKKKNELEAIKLAVLAHQEIGTKIEAGISFIEHMQKIPAYLAEYSSVLSEAKRDLDGEKLANHHPLAFTGALSSFKPSTEEIKESRARKLECIDSVTQSLRVLLDSLNTKSARKVDNITRQLNRLIAGVATLPVEADKAQFNSPEHPDLNLHELSSQLRSLSTFDQSTTIKKMAYHKIVLELEEKISKAASKANPLIEIQRRQNADETNVVRGLIETLNGQMNNVGSADPRHGLLRGMKEELNTKLTEYLPGGSVVTKDAFLLGAIQCIGSHLTEEKLSSLSQYPELIEPFVSFIRNLLTPLVKWFTGKTYQSGFFASKAEVVVADSAQKAHQSLSEIRLTLDQFSNAAGAVVLSTSPPSQHSQ